MVGLGSLGSVWGPYDWRNVKRVVRTAVKIIGTSPPFRTLLPSAACPKLRILSKTPPTLTMDCFPCWPLERGSAAFGARPQGSVTAPPCQL